MNISVNENLRVVDAGDWGVEVERVIPHAFGVEEDVTDRVIVFPAELDGLIDALQKMRERKQS